MTETQNNYFPSKVDLDLQYKAENEKLNQEGAVKLEEAFELAGFGLYNYLVMLAAGLALFTGMGVLLAVSYILPATNCDLKLSTEQKGILTSMAFTGIIFSAHLSGYLSDKYGRKCIILWSNFLCASLTVIAMFAPNYSTLAVLFFLNGFIASGLLSPVYVYVCEFCTIKYHATSLLITGAVSAIVTSYFPILALFIMPLTFRYALGFGLEFNSWRLFIGLTAITPLLSNLILYPLYESPKFLLIKGKNQETLEALKKMFSLNKRQPPTDFPINNICLDSKDAKAKSQEKEKNSFLLSMWKQTAILFFPPQLKGTLISCILQLGCSGSYTVIMLWLNEIINRMSIYSKNNPVYEATVCDVFKYKKEISIILNGTTNQYSNISFLALDGNQTFPCTSIVNQHIYVASIGIGLVQVLSCCIIGKIIAILGRKTILVIFLLGSAIFYFALTIIKGMVASIVALGIVVILTGATLPISISIIVDYFPTNMRGMATCICMVAGRLGSALGGIFFGYLQENYCTYSYYGLSLMSLGILAMSLFIQIKE